MAHALAAHFGPGDFDAAALADDALVAHPLVLATVTFPVLGGTEYALAEKPVLLRLERTVVDGLGLGDFSRRPGSDLLGRRKADPDGIKIIDV